MHRSNRLISVAIGLTILNGIVGILIGVLSLGNVYINWFGFIEKIEARDNKSRVLLIWVCAIHSVVAGAIAIACACVLLFPPRRIALGTLSSLVTIVMSVMLALIGLLYGPTIAIVVHPKVRREFVPVPGEIDSCCKTCGYDLTGNVSGICPECGVEIRSEILPRKPESQA